jgi:hypothetical protein
MGTWRRVGTPGTPELAFHYWQAAEEIRLFGPITGESKPTDARDWECQERFRMVGVDARSIRTETTRWFLDEATCLSTPPEPVSAGCVSGALAVSPTPP